MRIMNDNNHTLDGDSAMRVTKAPTEGSANWMKSISGVSGEKVGDSPGGKQPDGIIDLRRLQGLGLGKLAEKVGETLQLKLQEEVTKYDKPVKLKVMTGRDVKKMKNQFSIFFEEPKTKAAAIATHRLYRQS